VRLWLINVLRSQPKIVSYIDYALVRHPAVKSFTWHSFNLYDTSLFMTDVDMTTLAGLDSNNVCSSKLFHAQML
jgi:hypothetical protein